MFIVCLQAPRGLSARTRGQTHTQALEIIRLSGSSSSTVSWKRKELFLCNSSWEAIAPFHAFWLLLLRVFMKITARHCEGLHDCCSAVVFACARFRAHQPPSAHCLGYCEARFDVYLLIFWQCTRHISLAQSRLWFPERAALTAEVSSSSVFPVCLFGHDCCSPVRSDWSFWTDLPPTATAAQETLA